MTLFYTICLWVGLIGILTIVVLLGIPACDALFVTDLDDAAGVCRGQGDQSNKPPTFCPTCGHELDPKDSCV